MTEAESKKKKEGAEEKDKEKKEEVSEEKGKEEKEGTSAAAEGAEKTHAMGHGIYAREAGKCVSITNIAGEFLAEIIAKYASLSLSH